MDSTGQLADAWHVKAFLFRRDPLVEGNQYLPNREGSNFGWDVMVSMRGEDDTPTSLGTQLAEELTAFAANVPDFRTPPAFNFRHDLTTNPPRPLNYYLCDGDCLSLLKRLYAQDNEKDSIMENEELMTSYFGSIELGQQLLRPLSDAVWKDVD